jgi:predicted RecA/RadA family phage recombinase
MAKNFVFKEAEYLSLPVPTGTKAGSPVRVGVLNAVTVTDEASVTQTITLGAGAQLIQPSGSASSNEPGFASVALKGSANLRVVGATTVGAPVYIKTADNTLTSTAAAGTKLFGAALRAKTAPAADVLVKILNPGIAADAA